ncbi:amino acid ABC transporter [Thermanaerothrix daxensis]|uniref:Amino acid ABC transporter n=1 Tax=Thermanaerothrix daxensis TaxID=869279 RepID=A0A0P6YPA3_9CHLR|nr:amino acid ABC transporter [Thermanaerothrix daxensis]
MSWPRLHWGARLKAIPWWLVAMGLIAIYTAITIYSRPSYRQAFDFIKVGLSITLSTTLFAFGIAVVIGLITGLGRLSNNLLFKNLATLYIELVRGIPMLVLIFYIALVGMPGVVSALNQLGHWLSGVGAGELGSRLSSLENNAISMGVRAITALSITYGAFLAEVFRAGIQSIPKGQMEAARSLGMTYGQAMRFVILPQAVRNILPALGNDFISMLKDSSLVSVLAVRDITQVTRLYAARSFQYQEAYTTLAVMYLTMTMVLSFIVKAIEKRMHRV